MGTFTKAIMVEDTLSVSKDEAPPAHSSVLITVIFSVLGLGQLLPWNCFINSNDYWMLKFADDEDAWKAQTHDHPVDMSSYQNFWTSALALSTMSISTVFMILNMVLAPKISQNLRIYPTLSVMLGIFAYTAIMTQVKTASW